MTRPRPLTAIFETLETLDEGLGVVWDLFEGSLQIVAEPPWGGELGPWAESDDTRLEIWLQRSGQRTTLDAVRRALQLAAELRAIDPLTVEVERCLGIWDSMPRIDRWLIDYLGCMPGPDQSEQYLMRAGSYWLRSCAARALDPGCKADAVLVLEGPQGARKSTVLEVLGGRFYGSARIPFGDGRQAPTAIQGSWIHELCELADLGRSEISEVKSFVALRADQYLPPYGRRRVTRPRRVAFAATTNQRAYLLDSTGNRRWWPAHCGQIDLPSLIEDRDQLLGEAAAHFLAGERWWPLAEEEPLFARVADARRLEDPIEELVLAQLREHADFISTDQIFGRLDLPRTRALAHRVAAICEADGWIRARGHAADSSQPRARGWKRLERLPDQGPEFD